MTGSSQEDQIENAISVGTMWLNPVFRFRDIDRPIKFGFLGRTNPLEIFWGTLCALIVAGLLFGFDKMLGGMEWPLGFIYKFPALIAWALIAFVLGRKLAYLSPLRKQTGEGTGTWASLVIRKALRNVSHVVGSPTMYNVYKTCAGNSNREPRDTVCVEWIGSAKSPRAPFLLEPQDLPRQDNSYDPDMASSAQHLFVPRGDAIPAHFYSQPRRTQ